MIILFLGLILFISSYSLVNNKIYDDVEKIDNRKVEINSLKQEFVKESGEILSLSVTQTILATVTVNSVLGELNVSPFLLETNAPPLSFVEKTLNFWQENGNIDLNVNLSSNLNWISFSENNFIVKSNETKNIITYINIPQTTIGTYSGDIYAMTNSEVLTIPVNITVTDKYKLDVNITVTQDQIKAGESVPVFTELAKTKEHIEDPEVEGKIVVNLLYKVKRKAELITTLSTTMEVIDYNTSTILIPIPKDATRDIYTVEVIATYLDKIDRDKDAFYVTTIFLRTF